MEENHSLSVCSLAIQVYEGMECEWPLFFLYMYISGEAEDLQLYM